MTTRQDLPLCKSASCRRPIGRELFYCSRCFKRLWLRILGDAFDIHEAAAEDYTGRSGNPTERQLVHLAKRGYPCFSLLHWAHGIKEADFTEFAIGNELSKIGRHLKSKPHGDPGPRTGYYHGIYIAWRPKPGARLNKFDFLDASELGRAWPIAFPDFKAMHFRSSLTPAEARSLHSRNLQDQLEYGAKRRTRPILDR